MDWSENKASPNLVQCALYNSMNNTEVKLYKIDGLSPFKTSIPGLRHTQIVTFVSQKNIPALFHYMGMSENGVYPQL